MNNEFGKHLREKRSALGLTLKELADDVGVNRNTILLWEEGGNLPNLHYAIILADYFNCSIDELVRGVNKNTKERVSSWVQPLTNA